MLRITVPAVSTVALVALLLASDVLSPPSPQDVDTTPIHQMSKTQLDQHLRSLATKEPDPATRLCRLAAQTVGQPYKANALGEGPSSPTAPQPLYALNYSDSLSFVEQTLAMSVASDFDGFFLVLQRLRYKGGEPSTLTRTHNILADWPSSNSWLLDDVTEQLAGGTAWVPVHQVVRRAAFLKEQYGLTTDMADEKFIGACIPRVYWYKVVPDLHAGDVVLLITGNDRQQFCSEVGVIVEGGAEDGWPLDLVKSNAPAVTKDGFRTTVLARKDIIGFKILRLRRDAVTAAATAAEQMRAKVQLPE